MCDLLLTFLPYACSTVVQQPYEYILSRPRAHATGTPLGAFRGGKPGWGGVAGGRLLGPTLGSWGLLGLWLAGRCLVGSGGNLAAGCVPSVNNISSCDGRRWVPSLCDSHWASGVVALHVGSRGAFVCCALRRGTVEMCEMFCPLPLWPLFPVRPDLYPHLFSLPIQQALTRLRVCVQ